MRVAKQKMKSLIKASAKQMALAVNAPLGVLGCQIIRKPRHGRHFSWDGLSTIHDSSFMQDEAFLDAYNHAKRLIGKDYRWYWRNYLGIKLAEYAYSLSPNFVECGVGEGWMTVSILRYLGKKYSNIPSYALFDTFSGIDPAVVDAREEEHWGVSASEKQGAFKYLYNADAETVKKRIEATAGMDNKASIIQGPIPTTLSESVLEDIRRKGPIAFLHIDMNNSVPEVAALKQFYPMMATGGVVLLDDYAYCGFTFQKNAIDQACQEMGVPIPISLPSGQGLLLKRM